MAEFSVRALDHVTVTTPEELAADVLAWYGSILELDRIDKPEGASREGGWFRVGDLELHVSLDEHNPPPRAHFGLEVDEHQAVVERLRAANCHIEQARPLAGRRRFFTRDPAGNRVEIVSYP